MAQPGDLVQSKWEIDVRDDGKYYDKRHRIGIVLSIADRRTLKKKDIFWVRWNDGLLPKKSLMISTEIEIISKK
jgi:hypothetical protein